MVRAATTSANTTTTAMTMRATMGGSFLVAGPEVRASGECGQSVHHKRRRATDLDHLNPLAGVDHLVFVVAARGPHLTALDLDATDALVVGDPLQHHRMTADQRSR